VFSGLGSEEIFAGYQRHEQARNVNRECLQGLSMMWERDTYRDYTLSKHFKIKLKLPFLDDKLVRYALNIPGKHKINKEYKKIILRKIAEQIGVQKNVAWRKKKAAQYGSQSDKVLERLSKNKGLTKTDYLRTKYEPMLRLGALFSGGKDSTLALYLMKKKGHDIRCLITMLNEREDSYMFHKPIKKITKVQSEALGIPVLFGRTKGIKEKELRDLEKLILKAKEKYELDGIITGALYSNYQRERIENINKKHGLSTHSPLWHMSQEQELHTLLKQKFVFIMTSIAALGLNKDWLGKKITIEDVHKLKSLEKLYGINMAGEGGEYETLVLDCPLFKHKLVITDYEIIEENTNTAKIKIKKIKSF
jgi:asparagine synthase (glutamine-hydrolysing)